MVWDSLNDDQKKEVEKLQIEVTKKLKDILERVARGEEIEDLKYLGVTITPEEAKKQLEFFK